MNFHFCWEYNGCRSSCPARDLKILLCWKYFEEECKAGIKACHDCAYRQAWETDGFAWEEISKRDGCLKKKGNKKTILVVDDEPNILYALEETVQIKGYACVSASDGEDGLTIARSIKPDLIITDIIMPRMNGYQLCHALKSDQATCDIPVIMITVRTEERDRLDGNLAGADAYIMKPFSPSQLKEKIELFILPDA